MAHIALLGAGFSRNWGGWLATELLGELLGRIAEDSDTYSKLRRSKNFENTLSELQTEARQQKKPGENSRLDHFERAVLDVFSEMNQVFADLPGWHLSNDAADSIDDFLSKFDAIFTLNQDLLLELHYRPNKKGMVFPGMTPPPNWQQLQAKEKLEPTWHPMDKVEVDKNSQPIFKLHGSVNWRDPSGDQLMVMGGNKVESIGRHPVLSNYFELFNKYLFEGNTKVMAIGYGFQDTHINDVLVRAGTEHGMQMHLVNPSGLEVLRRYPATAIQGPNELDDIPLIGVTSRSLRESFSGDKLSIKSLLRFFS